MVKEKILSLLKDSKNPVSGQIISKNLKISRVAVWKHIKLLKKVGYDISASSSGYLLKENNDLLLPWEFPEHKNIHYFKKVASTMNLAKELAIKGCPDKTIVIAESQKSGRGRIKRIWDSRPGGLYFTIIFRPDIPLNYAFLYNFASSVTIVETINEYLNIETTIKWPNDILIEGKKIAGILLDLSGELDNIQYLNLGIGININNQISSKLPEATSLSIIKGKHLYRKEILKIFLKKLNKYTSDIFNSGILEKYRSYSSTLYNFVTVNQHGGKIIKGQAINIDDNGNLIIKDAKNKNISISSGDCINE